MRKNLQFTLQPPLDNLANVSDTLEPIESESVFGAIEDLCTAHPRLREHLFQERELSPFIHIFLNGNLVPAELTRSRNVSDRDELCLLTAIRGG